MTRETKAFGSFTIALLLGILALFALIATELVDEPFPYLTVLMATSWLAGGIFWMMNHTHATAALLAIAFNCLILTCTTIIVRGVQQTLWLGIVACIGNGIITIAVAYRASSSIGGGLVWMLASIAFVSMTLFYFNEFHEPGAVIAGIVAPVVAFGFYIRDQRDPLMHSPPPA